MSNPIQKSPTPQATTKPAAAPVTPPATTTSQAAPAPATAPHVSVSPEQLAREAEYLRRELDLKQKLSEAQAHAPKLKQLEQLEQELKSDPYAVAEKYGASLETWAKRVANGTGLPTADERIAALTSEIQSLKSAIEKQTLDSESLRSRVQYQSYTNTMLEHMNKEPEKYQPIKQFFGLLREINGGEPDLVGAIQSYMNNMREQTGKVLTPIEAADSMLSDATRILGKIAPLFVQATATSPANPPVSAPSAQPTLTAGSETDGGPGPDTTKLDHDARLNAVIRKFRSGAYGKIIRER